MEFIKQYLDDIQTPILLPSHLKPLAIVDGSVRYTDTTTNKTNEDEPLIHHDGQHVILDQYRKYFPNDEVIVLLRGQGGALIYQRRSYNKSWEPGTICIPSVVGQVRAIREGDRFVSEGFHRAAQRELLEETGMARALFLLESLICVGEHYNTVTNAYQQIYVCPFNESLDYLNGYAKAHADGEVDEWFEGDWDTVITYYCGEGANEHSGGSAFLGTTFLYNRDVRSTLDAYFRKK